MVFSLGCFPSVPMIMNRLLRDRDIGKLQMERRRVFFLRAGKCLALGFRWSASLALLGRCTLKSCSSVLEREFVLNPDNHCTERALPALRGCGEVRSKSTARRNFESQDNRENLRADHQSHDSHQRGFRRRILLQLWPGKPRHAENFEYLSPTRVMLPRLPSETNWCSIFTNRQNPLHTYASLDTTSHLRPGYSGIRPPHQLDVLVVRLAGSTRSQPYHPSRVARATRAADLGDALAKLLPRQMCNCRSGPRLKPRHCRETVSRPFARMFSPSGYD